MNKYLYQAYRYALIICRNKQNKYLVIQQTKNRGWWIPGGKLEPNETFFEAAKRECLEETGIKIKVKGILRIDYGSYSSVNALRVIFYAEPKQQSQIPKIFADQNSEKAMFYSLQQIKQLKWRGNQIWQFPKYLEEGGTIYPLSILMQKFN